MKKLNKKGFTLAELLIVIAIIAILIAIAIPVFAGQLDNAKLQTDHANIRSAYAMYQVAQLEGGLYIGNSTDFQTLEDIKGKTLFFGADGSLTEDTNAAYIIKADGDKDNTTAKCSGSAGCKKTAADGTVTYMHKAGAKIQITCAADGKSISWTIA